MPNPSNAGPYKVGPSGPLAAGETKEIQLTEVKAGPADQKGYLRGVYGERGGMDFLFIVNASSELISVYTKGGQTIVPSATSQSLTNGPYDSLRVVNEGSVSINNDSTDRIAIEVGNVERGDNTGGRWNSRRAISDLVPGLEL